MIRARITWSKDPQAVLHANFAYPLREGDTFVVGEGEQRFICKVETIVHFPTNIDSDDAPSVGYYVQKVPATGYMSHWSTILDIVSTAFKSK